MKLLKLFIFLLVAAVIATLAWWIKENPDAWNKYKPTKVDVGKIKEPVEKAKKAIEINVKDHMPEKIVESPKPIMAKPIKEEKPRPVAKLEPEPEPIITESKSLETVVKSPKVEALEPKNDIVEAESSYDKHLTTDEALSIIQALRGKKESK